MRSDDIETNLEQQGSILDVRNAEIISPDYGMKYSNKKKVHISIG